MNNERPQHISEIYSNPQRRGCFAENYSSVCKIDSDFVARWFDNDVTLTLYIQIY